MKILLFISVFLISHGIYSQSNKPITCQVKDGTFIVTNQKGEVLKKFIERTDDSYYKCGNDIAAAFIGEFLVTSNGEKIISKKLSEKVDYKNPNLMTTTNSVGIVNNSKLIVSDGTLFVEKDFDDKYNNKEYIHLKSSENLIGGMVGEVFFASNGKEIKRRVFNQFTAETKPQVSVHKNIIGIYWQDYLISSDFKNLEHRPLEKIEGKAKTASAENRFAVVHGNYLYLSNGDENKRKYFSNLNISKAQLKGHKNVIGAYIKPYFVAIDSKRFTINTKYIDKPGDLNVSENFAIYSTADTVYIYNAMTGEFSSKRSY